MLIPSLRPAGVYPAELPDSGPGPAVYSHRRDAPLPTVTVHGPITENHSLAPGQTVNGSRHLLPAFTSPVNGTSPNQPPIWPATLFANFLAPGHPAFAGPLPTMNSPVPFDPSSDPPFTDRTVFYHPRPHGVIKIKNIPYGLTIAEVHQFIGKHVHFEDLIKPHEEGFPIHIIMERSTGKTMDCYVETATPEIAAQAWERGFGLARMRHPKLGQRHVTVELSDQAELMKDLFPRARNVVWDAATFGTPHVVQTADIFSSGFNGFFTSEEMSGVVRHAEHPHRSPFAMRSFQRTYESTISSLYKFPWYAGDLYTMKQRDNLFKTYHRQLVLLMQKVDPHNSHSREVGLDNKLLMDFVFAGMNCAGFSERQKAQITKISFRVGPGMRLSAHAHYWPFQALSTHPVMLSDQDVCMWFEILNLGMVAYEREGRQFIGARPYIQLMRNAKGYILFEYNDEGSELPRDAYAALETQVMVNLMRRGWISYLHQAGIAPPLPSTPDSEQYEQSVYQAILDSFDTNGTSGGDSDEGGNRDYTSQERLDAYRQVLADIATEDEEKLDDPEENLGAANGDGGLGAGLMSLNLAAARNGHHRSSGSPPLNPESPNFEPTEWRQRPASDSAVDTVFSGTGLGNGIISPPRISTARQRGMSGSVPVASVDAAFQIPRRERRAVSIRSPDGTPLNISASAETVTAAQGNESTAPDGMTTPRRPTQVTPAVTPVTPAATPATPNNSGSEKIVIMPTIGKPSPGHTKNFGSSSKLTFGTAVGSASGSGYANATGSPARPGHRARTQSRSAFNVNATINEESEVVHFEKGGARNNYY